MTTVNRTGQTTQVQPKNCDTTPPPTPEVRRAIAFEHGSERARVVDGNNAGRAPRAPRDPVLIELGNVEMDVTVEVINKSKNPKATFDANALQLTLTGADPHQRRASVYLTVEQMNQLDIKPGDILDLRVKDAAGNASVPVRIEVEPDDWANRTVRDVENNAWVNRRGAQITGALDGVETYKNFIAKAVADDRPPVLLMDDVQLTTHQFNEKERDVARAFIDNIEPLKQKLGKDWFVREELDTLISDEALPEALRTAAKRLKDTEGLFEKIEMAPGNNGWIDGRIGVPDLQPVAEGKPLVVLEGVEAIEPRSRVRVFNNRTGETFETNVGDDQKLKLTLGDKVANGDRLLIQPFDNEGNAGQEIKVVYSDCSPNGKAEVQSSLNLRIKPAIP